MSAQGTHATEKPWRELLVGWPQRLQPQQLQRQKEREKGKAVKEKDPNHPQEDAAKAKAKTRQGLQVAQGPPVMNGRKPGNVHVSVANTPTHITDVGRAPMDVLSPKGKERARAATSPPEYRLAARVLPNRVTFTARGHA